MISFLLFVFYIFTKYARVVFLTGKKGIEITNAFQTTLDESGRTKNKLWLDKSVKSWSQDDVLEMFSVQNERNSVVAETIVGK